jgi:hypothetical protein
MPAPYSFRLEAQSTSGVHLVGDCGLIVRTHHIHIRLRRFESLDRVICLVDPPLRYNDNNK